MIGPSSSSRVDVVRGGAHGLHAAGVGLVVRLGALEAGQERVVDVDRLAVQLAGESVAEDLHVAGQHHQFDVELVDELQQPCLPPRAWWRR